MGAFDDKNPLGRDTFTTDDLKAYARYLDDDGDEGKLKEEINDAIDQAGDADWINEDYWSNYVYELADETSGMDLNEWPATCIDWSQAERELAHDYLEVEIDGNNYYTRER